MSPQNRQPPPSKLDITCAGIVLLLAAASIIGVHACEARGADGTPAHIIFQIIVSTYSLCNIIYFIAFLIIRETNANPIPKFWTIRAACAPILLVLTAPALLILGIEKAWESTKKLRKHLSDTAGDLMLEGLGCLCLLLVPPIGIIIALVLLLL